MTQKQLALLRFIRNKLVHAGTGPTFKEMREYMRVTSNQTVDDLLSGLEREGYIEIISGKQRGINVTPKAQEIEKKHTLEQTKDLPTTFTSISSNASTSFTPTSQVVSGIYFQSNGIIPWKKGGERNGTT